MQCAMCEEVISQHQKHHMCVFRPWLCMNEIRPGSWWPHKRQWASPRCVSPQTTAPHLTAPLQPNARLSISPAESHWSPRAAGPNAHSSIYTHTHKLIFSSCRRVACVRVCVCFLTHRTSCWQIWHPGRHLQTQQHHVTHNDESDFGHMTTVQNSMTLLHKNTVTDTDVWRVDGSRHRTLKHKLTSRLCLCVFTCAGLWTQAVYKHIPSWWTCFLSRTSGTATDQKEKLMKRATHLSRTHPSIKLWDV